MTNGHEASTVTEALKISNFIEKEEKRVQQLAPSKETKNKRSKRNRLGSEDGRKKEKGKYKDKNKKEPRNPCKLPGHQNHDYSDCKFNPKSSNYCGTTRTLKDYDRDGKLNESAKRRGKENHSNDRNSNNNESDVESNEEVNYCS